MLSPANMNDPGPLACGGKTKVNENCLSFWGKGISCPIFLKKGKQEN